VRIRPERVAERMKREIAAIMARELDDPRVSAMVSVTDVELTKDLSFARVFVSVLEQGEERESTLAALQRAAGFVRHQLAPRLGLREVPEIRFLHDDSIERGARVDEILRKLERGEPVDDEGDGGR
jgi:ribosome-binding factor A